jgi:orotidine-5'-phosphate decarboxylase
MQSLNRLIVAIDRSPRDEILGLVDKLHGVANVFKIGLQAFIANGPSIVREITARGEKVFLDLKIHDIPNTAGKAVAEGAAHGASMMTVHASGGEAMLRACSVATPLILGVTVLTSLGDRELQRIGFATTATDTAVNLAMLAQKSGLRGVVASPQDIEAIRRACGDDLIIVAPGIRINGATDDQRRTATPAAAIAAGADYFVVGRPITAAADPRSAAQAIVDSLR